MGTRLRELAPAARGSQEAGFTQPRNHCLAEPCTYPESLLEPPIVGDVFSLRHPAVDIKVNPREFVLVVLINDTLGLPPELLYGDVVPPLLQVSVFIKLPAPRKDKKLP